jgi:hypothetical protein
VLSIAQHHFDSNTLKEHLHQALVNIVTVDVKDGGTPKRKGKVVFNFIVQQNLYQTMFIYTGYL